MNHVTAVRKPLRFLKSIGPYRQVVVSCYHWALRRLQLIRITLFNCGKYVALVGSGMFV